MRILPDKRLEILVSRIFLVSISVVLSIIIKIIWQETSLTYHPNIRASLLSMIFSFIAIYLTSKILVHFLNNPTQYVYLAALPINMIGFGIVFFILIFTRQPYQRPDLLIYFLTSSFVFIAASFIYENNRKFIFIYINNGSNALNINNKNVIIFEKDLNDIRNSSWDNLKVVDGVVIDFSKEISDEVKYFLGESSIRGAKIYGRSEIIERFDGYVPLESFAEISVGWRAGFEVYEVFKQIVDVLIAIFLLPLFLIVILSAGIFIMIDTPGPFIFKQKRVGRYGKEFYIYKLRTMYYGNEGKKIVNTTADDPRVTRVGKILRRMRIDELPQVINIIRGEMSWIGPRPETVELTMKYKECIPLYLYRLHLHPGLSGWAAVNQGYVGSEDKTLLKLRYDLFYLKYVCFELDCLILFKTLSVLISGKGAL